ncbi:HTH_Tnp_1_2 domain-containing protein [Clostridium neonatale]|uniref:phBC6A51 family helix-turn-helix protein n=1 Tax=Clostridium neonatale TaxID=137838 RepID=UPI00291B88E7|nr:phBC6A51 family helix-turn-helix protein [Clostridium neonatale]CAI3674331.1 HTH_Tnp_1_2 domain-containing protein [Clostridium neonatale]
MAIKELNEEQLRACELVAKGENNTNIAKLIGKTRKTVIEWKKDDMFKAEVDRQVSLLKSRVDEKIAMNVEPLMDKLMQIALKSDSEKTSLDAIIYAVNRFVGTPTNKTQDITENKDSNSNVDIDSMIESLKKENNVINLDDVKSC